MTRDITIDTAKLPPVVCVNGVQVACSVEMTYHEEGGLNVKKIVVKHIPVVPEEEDGMRTRGELRV